MGFKIAAMLLLIPMSLAQADSSVMVKDMVSEYFQEKFDVPSSDIQLKFIHLPELKMPVCAGSRIAIESKHNNPKLGFQTLWLKIYDNEYLKRSMPVTVEMMIYLDVTVAGKKLNRDEILTRDKIAIKRLLISSGYKDLILDLDSIDGLVSRQVIKENTILKRRMVRVPPDVKWGEQVTVQLKSGDLTVTTAGKSRQDGMIGERVKVVCNMTGKQITGTVQSPQVVVVNLK